MFRTKAEAARFGRERYLSCRTFPPSLPLGQGSSVRSQSVSGRAQLWMGMKNILFV